MGVGVGVGELEITTDVDGVSLHSSGTLRVHRITFDAGLTFELLVGGRRRVIVGIEQPFVLRPGIGPALSVDPPFARADAAELRLLLDTWQAEVTELRATDLGALHLAFSTGTTLDCPWHAEYGAWTLDVPRLLTLVSVPGGELARWRADDDQP